MSIKQAIEALERASEALPAIGKVHEQIEAALAALRSMPAEPVAESWEHAGNFYNQTRHALMDVGANHGGCKFRLESMANELRQLMQATPHTAPVPAEPVKAAAWMRHDDPRQVISAMEKSEAVAAGGAFAASVARYDTPLVHQHEATSDAWQPIETAPKDGTAILVSEGRFIHCVEWNDEYEWWAVDDNKLGPFRLRGTAPTHWMPLPPPPAAALAGESQG